MVEKLDPKLISTVMWSLSIFDGFQRPLYRHILAVLHTRSVADFEPISLRSVLQVTCTTSFM